MSEELKNLLVQLGTCLIAGTAVALMFAPIVVLFAIILYVFRWLA